MIFTRRSVLIASSALLAGCGGSYSRPAAGVQARRLSSQASFYVAMPSDGRYGSRVYSGSGATVVQMVRGALLKQARRVEVGNAVETQDAALQSARAKGLNYAVVPTITHWEQRRTGWSGMPSRVEMILEVVDVGSGELVAKNTIGGNSTSVTFSWRSTHPEDVLREPLETYVASLFASGA